jgi:hypothetical protein
MYLEFILIGAAAIVIIVALLSSKFVRAILQETIFRPHKHCEIKVHEKGISVKNIEPNQKMEE